MAKEKPPRLESPLGRGFFFSGILRQFPQHDLSQDLHRQVADLRRLEPCRDRRVNIPSRQRNVAGDTRTHDGSAVAEDPNN